MLKIGPHITLPNFPLLLAPMEDVSDPPFRALCKDHGADLMFTEFISSEGLIKEAIRCRRKLDIYDYEKPIGIQIFGGDEDSLALASKIVEATNPDLLDINFGCPVKKVAMNGAGSGVLKDMQLMTRLTTAVVKSTHLPVTVKTRLGWDEDTKNIEEVAWRLQDAGVQALAIHGRTRMQMYKGEANWELIAKVKNNPRITIPIFGNGDIDSPEKALEYKNKYGVDGIMIGRAAIGYPWIFNEIKHYIATGNRLPPPTIEDRVAVCKKHLKKNMEWRDPYIGLIEMRMRYATYLRGLPNLKEHRAKLVVQKTIEEVYEVLDELVKVYSGYNFEPTNIELINYHEKCPV
jgi:tRNA-dihydrouridine synthase B